MEDAEIRDVRLSDRGDRFTKFVKGESVPGFFSEDFVPLLSRHYGMWLEKVKSKQAAPEVLTVLDDLMAGLTSTIELGKLAHERIVKRRFGALMEAKR